MTRPGAKRNADASLRVMLTWSSLGNDLPRPSDLARLVRSAPRDGLLRALTMVAAVVMNGAFERQQDQIRLQGAIARELLRGPLGDKAQADFAAGRWQYFLAPEGFLLAIKAVIRLGKPSVAEPSGVGEVLAQLILTANDLATSRSETREDLEGYLIRGWWFARHDQSRFALARYYKLLSGSRDATAPNYLDLDRTFREASGGLGIIEFVASVFVVYSLYYRYKTAQDVGRFAFGNESRVMRARSRDDSKRRSFERLVVRSPAQLRRELREGEPRFVFGLGALRPLLNAPLIRLRDGTMVPVWMPLILELAADGPRWILQDHLSRSAGTAAIKKLNALLGHRFQDYGTGLLARCYPDVGPLQLLFREQEYGAAKRRRRGTDAILSIGDAAVFFEMTVTAPSATVLWSGSSQVYRDFLARAVEPKIAELERCVSDYLDGRLGYVTTPPSQVRRIFPILLTLQAYPLHPLLAPLYQKALAGSRYLSGSQLGTRGVQKLRFLTIEELEMVEGALHRGQANLVGLLQEWCLADPDGSTPFKNFLLIQKGMTEIPSSQLEADFRKLEEEMKAVAGQLFVIDDIGHDKPTPAGA